MAGGEEREAERYQSDIAANLDPERGQYEDHDRDPDQNPADPEDTHLGTSCFRDPLYQRRSSLTRRGIRETARAPTTLALAGGIEKKYVRLVDRVSGGLEL